MKRETPIFLSSFSLVRVREEPDGRFTAHLLGADDIQATAATREAAVEQVRALLQADTLLDLAEFPHVPYDQPAEDEFQQLRSIRIGTRDLKIASIALANQLIVITRNRRDFARVPGLTIEDWSV